MAENNTKTIKLTSKQKNFCDEYIICQNATEAAIRAGYSKKTAGTQGYENMQKPHIRAYIEERMKEHESELVATQKEVLQYLTAVMRGQTVAVEVVVEGIGDGYSEARTIEKAPSERDRLLAADKLSKCYGLYNDKDKLELDRKRYELEKERLELEKQRQNLGGTDESQSGVVLLASILEEDDDEEDDDE